MLAAALSIALGTGFASCQEDVTPTKGRPGPAGPAQQRPTPAQSPQAAQTSEAPRRSAPWSAQEAAGKRGLRVNAEGAFEGYTLVSPNNSREVHLLDMQGNIVHTWATGSVPGGAVQLLADGHLLRCGQAPDNPRFHGRGLAGLIEEIAWDGTVVWQYRLANGDVTQHHEVEALPNGNVLAIAWEHRTQEEALAAGRDPAWVGEKGLWPDTVVELKPLPPDGAEVVWTWRLWDHLVQDRNPRAPNHGAPRDVPGRVDINFDHRGAPAVEVQESEEDRLAREAQEETLRQMGYVGGEDPAPSAGDGPQRNPDFVHTNSVDYHPGLDLIVLSPRHASEAWVIDHSTTTAEAATSSGGRYGHGGDLLWRWGNPRIWGHGGEADQRLFHQHDVTWLPVDAGAPPRLLLFNNGIDRPSGEFSEVFELELPFDAARGFVRDGAAPWGPAAPAWVYSRSAGFYSGYISGAQRLGNGNTLICSGLPGHVFEVDPSGHVVWDFLNSLGGAVAATESGNVMPPNALFRALRIAKDDPRLAGKLGG